MARHPWVAAADEGIRWGVQLVVPNAPDALPRLMATGKRVEALGYDAAFIMDHPPIHADPWIALAGLAASTERLRLGSAVICAWYRHPAYVARLTADLDNLSRGRAILGLGAGWAEAEFRALGIPFLSVPRRQEGTEEALRIIQGAWGAEPFSFQGTHFGVESMRVEPPPVQRPGPPVLIGGSGEQRTLRQVARLADACNVREEDQGFLDSAVTDEERAAIVRRKFDALRAHCIEVGRPEEEILRTHFTLFLLLARTEAEANRKLDAFDIERTTSPGTRRSGKRQIFATTPARAAAYYRALAAVGAQYFIVQLDAADEETIELLATEVAPVVGDRA